MKHPTHSDTMKATALPSAATRIIPASPAKKAASITKQPDGSMAVTFGNGSTGTLAATDTDLQAFLVWTMINGEATK